MLNSRLIAIMKKCLAPFCVGLLAANFTAAPCRGADKAAVPATITMDINNEPLRSVLGKIARTTRWKIKAPDKWMDKPVTQALRKVTMEEGLKSVLSSVGVENQLLMYDEKLKVVTIFDTAPPSRESAIHLPVLASANEQPQAVLGTETKAPKRQGSLSGSRPLPSRIGRKVRNRLPADD
ncbi:MAG: hypothetical protein ACYC6Q_09310 [Syntrophales bacterium]